MTQFHPKLFVAILLGAAFTPAANAETTTTTVTTYVTKTQDERASTRWTLTEWLRIKERMKMMDVWLAIFSDPQKDKFTPELNLSYGLLNGTMAQSSDGSSGQDGAMQSRSLKGQLWLTNIISSTVGIRSLNIDLGFEAGNKTSLSSYEPDPTTSDTLSATQSPADTSFDRMHSVGYGSADLRLFGKNIQDTSLVLKYGQYTLRDTTLAGYDSVGASYSKDDVAVKQGGVMAGAEVQIYLLKFLGAEGTYHAYGNQSSMQPATGTSGHYVEYLGFLEISLLRIMVGHYEEDWRMVRPVDGGIYQTHESGLLTALKLQL